MGKPVSLFHKKIIKRKSSSAEQRKAELKKEFLNHCQKVIEHMEIFYRISMVNEKMTHLEQSLVHRPGNHLLRNQIKLC
jgi:hypothetical protein